MAAGDVRVQETVHSLDQGRFALLIRAGMFGAVIISLILIYLFVQFKGLDDAVAMDQAQIARNIADGKGFTTDYIRPLAVGTLKKAGKLSEEADVSNLPDISQAPLNPWINAIGMRLIKSHWKMTATDIVYVGDRMVAAIAILFFLLSMGVWYFVIARLFDQKLGLLTCGAVLVTDIMWQFSIAALPQMLLLFLFSIACLITLFAMEAQQREQFGLTVGLLVIAGIFFGLMVLGHGLAVWIFLGWLVFAGIYFQPRGLAALAALAAVLLIVAPWLVRNFQVCGNPFGLAIYDVFFNGLPEDSYLRSTDLNVGGGLGIFKAKLHTALLNQLGEIFQYLGMNILAMAFFLALLHPFRSRRTGAFRWCVLLMWASAAVGMALYNVISPVSSNQFHVLFIPLFASYGFAFLFVLWNRLELANFLLRIAFISGMIILCSIPMLNTLISNQGSRIQWPPYVPPFIGFLGNWFDKNEIVCSDMPWAVAWYAQRKSLLLPDNMQTFNRFHDYKEIAQPISGLYLTPITGNRPLFSDIYKGGYKDWAPLITRPPQIRGFALPAFTPLPIDGECIIFADRDRWNTRTSTE